MTRFALDHTALLHVVTEQLAVHPGHQLVAPGGVRTRAVNALLQQVRAGALSEREARELHTRLTELKLRALNDRVSRWVAFQLAAEHGWPTTDDAEYVAVARLQADALVALDPQLAARAEGLVPLAPVGDLLLAPQ